LLEFFVPICERQILVRDNTMPKPIDFEIGDILELRKPHPCGGHTWTVIRLGADIGIRCHECGRKVLMPRSELEKRVKKRIPAPSVEETT